MEGKKKIEYRSWRTACPVTLLIHAGKAAAGPKDLPRGAILGTVEVVDCRGSEGNWEWILKRPHPLAVPVPCSGNLGLWSPSAEVVAALPAEVQALATLPAPPAPKRKARGPKEPPPPPREWEYTARCDFCNALNKLPLKVVARHLCRKCGKAFGIEYDADDLERLKGGRPVRAEAPAARPKRPTKPPKPRAAAVKASTTPLAAQPQLVTCDFRRAKLLPADVAAVSIARWPPRTWGKGLRCMALAPSADLLRAAKSGAIDWEEYAAKYRAHLATLDPATVVASLPPRAALLCFCDPEEDCHRFLAAEWLGKALGIAIGEWEYEAEKPDAETDDQEPEMDYEARCDFCKANNKLPGKVDRHQCRKCGQYFPVTWD